MRPFRLTNKRALIALLVAGSAQASTPAFEEVRDRLIRSETAVLDRTGQVIHEQRTNLKKRQLGWVPISAISPSLQEAVIASEDQRFESHLGVDPWAIVGALKDRIRAKSSRGASTISMQVASMLDERLTPKHRRREWGQKLSQAVQALEIERSWSKSQILETYLNLVSFRGELQGVASAARGLFGKDPTGLNREESLVLASLIRAPEAHEDQVARRACALGSKLSPAVDCARVTDLLRGRRLWPQVFAPTAALAPHAARQLLKQGEHRSTLDSRIQARVTETLRKHVLSLRSRNMNDAAAVVVENATGKVLAYVGSVGSLSSAGEVDGVRARRQAGSTLKPFLYGLALERRYLTAASRLDDSATDISLGPGSVYHPQDFDHEYHGEDVTLRLALASSLNVPAVRTLQLVGVDRLVGRMKALGFSAMRSEEFYGPSLALGTADVSLWELVNAYRTLANQGRWSEMRISASPSSARIRRVMPSDAAFVIADILSDRLSRSLTFGLESPLSMRFWTAAKTGTSKDMRDNWCVGFSARYTVGVWAGNFSGQPMRNVTGISGAAPAWAEIVEFLHQSGKDKAPKPPRGLVRVAGEWYLKGTEPNPAFSNVSKPTHQAQITYPVEGLLIARDPDIPTERQRVFFEASSPTSSLRWVLNTQALGSADQPLAWRPEKPGNYELKLVDAQDQVVDRVEFMVR